MSLLMWVLACFTGLVAAGAIVCVRTWHQQKCNEFFETGLWLGKTQALWDRPDSSRVCWPSCTEVGCTNRNH